MKIERTKNATKNISVGLLLKLYQMLVPFLMRTAMIYFMGVEYLGLNSLFASILHVLNLAELGVGTAMVFSMYKPIAEDDRKAICSLMKLYRRYYRLIGLAIGAVGLLLTPLVPRLISGEVPSELNVYTLYLLNLGATVLTYWLFAYKNCLLQAHQKTSVISAVTILTNTIQYILQLVILLVWKNYYLYVLATLASQALNNVITALAVSKLYPQYRAEGSLEKPLVRQINGKIRDLFTGKLGSVILNYADTIVISAFLGLTTLAVYSNYYFIVTSVIGIIEIILASITAGLGNSFVVETRQKNYKDLEKFTFLFLWLVGMFSCCFLGLYQPFMELWVGKELMLSFEAVVCFSAYFFIYALNRFLNVYKDAAGLWHADRFRPLVTAAVNLSLNLLLVQVWGIYGVLLSTLLSIILVALPWLLRNLFSLFFEKQMLRCYLKQLLTYIAATVLAGSAVCLICQNICLSLWLTLPLCLLICLSVPNAMYFLFFRKTQAFREGIYFLDHMTKGKLSLKKRLLRRQSSAP